MAYCFRNAARRRVYFGQNYEVRETKSSGKSSYAASLAPDYARQVRQSVVEQSLEVIRRRLDALGLGEFSKPRMGGTLSLIL
jgi:hypothetical protein